MLEIEIFDSDDLTDMILFILILFLSVVKPFMPVVSKTTILFWGYLSNKKKFQKNI